MHPAVSVILFTVLSGAGFGLITIIGMNYPMSDDIVSVFINNAIAIGFAVIGLVASLFHLGHPERAWRALTQWRSSWLSREGIASILTLMVFGLYVLIWLFTGERTMWLGILASVGALITVFTTSMIYAQMKTVPHWNTVLTPIAYLAFSLCCGFLLASGLGTTANIAGISVAALSIGILLIAWAIKTLWWQRAGDASLLKMGSSVETATGLGKIGKVRLLEKPHSGENYLTKEMVHQVGRKHASKLRFIAMLIGGVLPIVIAVMVFIAALPLYTLTLSGLAMIIGLFAERWLFFAEAKHAVSLYY